jgi:hypothetical protein
VTTHHVYFSTATPWRLCLPLLLRPPLLPLMQLAGLVLQLLGLD